VQREVRRFGGLLGLADLRISGKVTHLQELEWLMGNLYSFGFVEYIFDKSSIVSGCFEI